MLDCLRKLYLKLQILREDKAQDLVEYALVMAVIALGSAAAMNSVAQSISVVFANVGSKLTNYST